MAPVVFDVDGWRFGCAICIEINYPELFLEYERLGVDCVLVSSYSDDPMFGVLAQGHAAGNSYWVGLSVPAQHSSAAPAGVVAPNGQWLARGCSDGVPAIVVVDLDPSAEDAAEAVKHRRPWRRTARSVLCNDHFVTDPRSQNKTSFRCPRSVGERGGWCARWLHWRGERRGAYRTTDSGARTPVRRPSG